MYEAAFTLGDKPKLYTFKGTIRQGLKAFRRLNPRLPKIKAVTMRNLVIPPRVFIDALLKQHKIQIEKEKETK